MTPLAGRREALGCSLCSDTNLYLIASYRNRFASGAAPEGTPRNLTKDSWTQKNFNCQRTSDADGIHGTVAAFLRRARRPGEMCGGGEPERSDRMVELIGIEPTTSGLQSPRSPS
jgi:hypothetical protein